MSRKKPAPSVPDKTSFHTPFAGLEALKGGLPNLAPTPAPEKRARAAPPRAVVRLERKGRRGKEVTVVEQLALSGPERQAWLGDMQRALGCGGSEEDGALVLQGDQRLRVEAFLKARGVARISLG